MNSKTVKELRSITNSIPKKLIDNLMVEQEVAPTVLEVARRAVLDPEVDPALKKRLQNLLEAGYLSEKEVAPDHEVEKKIDAWVEKQIKKAVKEGRLPAPKDNEDLKAFKKKAKKWKNKNTETSSSKTSKETSSK